LKCERERWWDYQKYCTSYAIWNWVKLSLEYKNIQHSYKIEMGEVGELLTTKTKNTSYIKFD